MNVTVGLLASKKDVPNCFFLDYSTNNERYGPDDARGDEVVVFLVRLVRAVPHRKGNDEGDDVDWDRHN